MALSLQDIKFAQSAISCAVRVGDWCPDVVGEGSPVHSLLSPEEKGALLQAVSNDGFVTSDELKSFGKFKNAEKMREIGTYIGDTPRMLFTAASRLGDLSHFTEWHSRKKEGWVTLDYRKEDAAAERAGFSQLQKMERDGINIFPAVRKLLEERGHYGSVMHVVAHLDFSTISLSEAKVLASLVREILPKAERSYGPSAQPVKDLKTALAKLTSSDTK